MKEIPKVDLQSKDIKSENIDKLRQLFPEIFTEGKIDFDKLKLTLGEEVDLEKEKYGMSWPGKARCFQIIQDRTTGTLKPVREESVDFDTTKNLFIEGDNLEVLKILQKSYFEKIKMIYIDPPYNTGKDFVYKDKFGQQLEEYLKLTNQVDSEGKKLSTNTDSDGRYHSNWMNMMYPRLYLARNLLKEDGVIFISIDDNEVDNLKKICNEIFGEENFVGIITRKIHTGKYDTDFSKIHDYMLIYKKKNSTLLNSKKIDVGNYTNKDNYFNIRGPYKECKLDNASHTYNKSLDYEINTPYGITVPGGNINNFNLRLSGGNSIKDWNWMWSKSKLDFGIENGFILFKNNKDNIQVYYKRYAYVDNSLKNIIRKIPLNSLFIESKYSSQQGTKDLRELFDNYKLFDSPKSIALMKEILFMGTGPGDIILDFFAGSATTAHAVLELNKENNDLRKFILVQLPEKTKEKSIAFKKGYQTISEISKERIRRVIKKIKEEQKQQKLSTDNKLDLGFKVFKLDRSNFKTWDGFSKDIQTTLTENIEQIKKSTDKEATLYELLLKEGFSLTEDIKKLQISDKSVYSINDNQLLICLEDKLTLDLFKEIKKLNPTTVIVLDKGFNENDQLKTNAVELMTKVDNDTNKKEYLLKAI